MSVKRRDIYAILLTGTLGAGKSTAARYLEAKFGYKHLSFVNEIWYPILEERGLSKTRENLQTLGIELMKTVGPHGLTELLLNRAGTERNVVIDDVRRKDVLEVFRDCCTVFCVFISADFETRYPRLVERDGVTSEDQQRSAELVETETTIHELEQVADTVIRNMGDLAQFHHALDLVATQAARVFGLSH